MPPSLKSAYVILEFGPPRTVFAQKEAVMYVLRLLILGTLLSVPAAMATSWYVKTDGTGAAPSLSAAIDSAASGDTILIGSGIFSKNANKNLDPGTKELVFRSEFG